MTYRRHGSKATIGMWTLVAVALLAAAVGPLATLVLLLATLILAGGALALRMASRRDSEPAEAAIRRRA